MKPAIVRRAALACCVTLGVWMFTLPGLFGQRGWRQGDMWIKWSHQARGAYVLGYFEGHTAAPGESSGHAANRWAGEVNVDEVGSSITDFYTRYPEDRDIYIREVIEQLRQGLTLEQIHNHPFWQHNPPQANP